MRSAWNIVGILSSVFFILTIYSFSDKTIKIGDIEIQKTEIKEFILGDTIPVEAYAAVRNTKDEKPVLDSSKQRILLIGDSMLEQLRWRCRDYTAFNGHELNTVIWYSAQTKWFGQTDTLRYFINKFKPTYIILVLGANELFVRDIIRKRTKYVHSILRQIDTIPYVWVGPPNWKDDTGINSMILHNVGRRHYFESKKLTFKRYKDGAHPLPESAAMWMDSIATWIMTESAHPILMNKPDRKYKEISPNTTILQPMR